MASVPDFLRFELQESSLMVYCEATVAPHEIDMGRCKEKIAEMISEHNCTEVVFGLGKVQFLSSRLSALMAAIQQLGVKVFLESPSPQILSLL